MTNCPVMKITLPINQWEAFDQISIAQSDSLEIFYCGTDSTYTNIRQLVGHSHFGIKFHGIFWSPLEDSTVLPEERINPKHTTRGEIRSPSQSKQMLSPPL